VNGETYLASVRFIPKEYNFNLVVVIAAPMAEFTGHIVRMAVDILVAAAGILLLIVPLAILIARRTSGSFTKLVSLSRKIQAFDYSPTAPITSGIKEIQELAGACEAMKVTIQSRTENLVRTQDKLNLLVEDGLALSAEKKLDRLIGQIFQTAGQLANADGGVMYLLEDGQLGVELLSLGAENLSLGGLSDNPAPRVMVLPDIGPFLSEDSVLRSACEAFTSRQMVTVRDQKLTLFPTGLAEEPSSSSIRSLIAVPIVTRQDEAIGVIQLFNPRTEESLPDGNGHLSDLGGFVGSLAALAAVTLDNTNLVNSLEKLLDALIRVLATSIDAKSPYTGGHCARVPEVAEMLARAAHDSDDGPLRDFRLQDDDAWRQLWIASWLHDCGKVSTPEYVVDKATKLETIYNRIHEIRTRFEVLRRDAELAYYRKIVAGEGEPETLRKELDTSFRSLEEDFSFIAACNEGAEFMSEEDKDRVRRIAGRTWMRYFSDRLGLSLAERNVIGSLAEAALPASEFLLSDKPEHLVPRTKDYSYFTDAQGNPLEAPVYEYNRGEVYNLCIPSGTLTAEERFKINEHAINGLEMLLQIPFPKNLPKVTEIASSHHETLVGTGYPLRKRKEQLDVESRILAIADIFEALTASDRPYKKAKKMSEALRIMAFMRDDQHIDADLFDVFLQKGVFRDYAKQYLSLSQMDVDDITPYLNKAH
jgi:HD-GYP domain-containing protein (c-di-GMP phosphodiesterase class II)/HAMP domain-containing protein